MKRFKRYTVVFAVILFFLVSSPVKAENYTVHQNPAFEVDLNPFTQEKTTEDYISEIYGEFGVGEMFDSLPESATEYIDVNDEKSINYDEAKNKLSFGFLMDSVVKILGKTLPLAVKSFIPLAAAVLVGALANSFRNSIVSDSLASALDFALVLCFAGALFIPVRDCFQTAKEYLESIHIFMTSAVPVMGSLTLASGNVGAAAVNSSGMFLLLSVVNIIANNFLMPVLQICFALSLATNISTSVNLNGISAYIRSVFMWIFVFIMTLLVTVLVYQNILASSADTVAARTIKFTVSSFIPVVGGVIGEASRTIMGSIQAVKSVSGILGVAVIIITLLPPLISVALNKFILKLLAALALILGIDKQADILKDMGSLLDTTVAVMISSAVVAIFMITVFIKTAAVV